MVNDYRRQLIEYFKKNLAKGYPENSLKIALRKQGYSLSTIDFALEQAHKEISEKAPILKEKPVIKHEIIDENNKTIIIKEKKKWWKFWE